MSSAGYTKVRTRVRGRSNMNAYDTVEVDVESEKEDLGTGVTSQSENAVDTSQSEDETEMYLNVEAPIAEQRFSKTTSGQHSSLTVPGREEYFDREVLVKQKISICNTIYMHYLLFYIDIQERDLGLTVTESFGPEHFRV